MKKVIALALLLGCDNTPKPAFPVNFNASIVEHAKFYWPASGSVSHGFYSNNSGPLAGWYVNEHGKPAKWEGYNNLHRGIDIENSAGTPILAAAHGIARIYYWNGSHYYGNRVVLDHQNGYFTLYAHLNTINVENGDMIYRGERVGTMGSTGNSTGPHVHFEIRLTGDGTSFEWQVYSPGDLSQTVSPANEIYWSFPVYAK